MTDLRLFNTPPAAAERAGASGGDFAFGADVWVEVAALLTTRVAVCELNGERLKARLGLINLGEARLAALKSEIVVEVTDREGASVAIDVVSSVSRESRGSARRKVTDADRLADVPKTAVDYDALVEAATNAATADSGGLLGSDFLERIRNPRLDNGTPLSVDELLALTCDAHILPAVFRNSTQPLWLGRRYRHASDAQRTALAKRDLGCVGCEAPPDRCQAHHIVHWAHGGPTDLDNLVLLCSRCHHHEVHTLGARVVQDTAGRYRLEHPPGPPTRRSRSPSHWAAYTSAPTLTIRLPHALTSPTPPAIPPDMLRGAINLDGLGDLAVPLIPSAPSTFEPIDISRRCPGGRNLEPGQRFQPRRRRGSHKPVPLACSGSDQPTAATTARPPAGNATDVPSPPGD